MRLALALLALTLLPGVQALTVYQVDVEGIITRGTREHVLEAIHRAEDGDGVVLLHLNTPGGLVDATVQMKEDVFNSRVPVLAWVGPRGSEAASAGSFLLLLGVPNGAAPGSVIGAAHPITDTGVSAGDKVTRYLVGHMDAIADRAGRNRTLARQLILENRTLTADEAHAAGLVDTIAPDVPSFLAAVDGREAVTAGANVTLDLAGATVVVVKPSLRSQLLQLISNPAVAIVLFTVGVYGIIFGLANPGTFVPETVGAVAILLGLVGIGGVDLNVGAVLLVLLGVALLITDLFAPTHGVLTVAGVAALGIGFLLLLQDEPLFPRGALRTFRAVGVTLAVVTAAVSLGAIGLALRVRRKPEFDTLRDATGVALENTGPGGGLVRVGGAIWKARSLTDIPAGTAVRVLWHEGLTLHVEPAGESPGTPPPRP